MFLEYILTDIIVIHPEYLSDDLDSNIDEITRKRFEGKIIKNKGLCLKVTQIQKLDSLVVNGTGNLDVKVKLSCLVFSSFRGELLAGTIKKSTQAGIEVDFCGIPVLIPKANLFKNTSL